MGAALQQGAQGSNFARQCALRAGLPHSVPGMSLDRQCSSGLMAIATAAKQVIADGMQVSVSDAPRPNEIVVAVVVTTGGRPLPRVGGLTVDGVKGEDGLR
jgi:hypothetical protein